MQFVTIATEAEVCQVGKQVGAASLRFHENALVTQNVTTESTRRAFDCHRVNSASAQLPRRPTSPLPAYTFPHSSYPYHVFRRILLSQFFPCTLQRCNRKTAPPSEN